MKDLGETSSLVKKICNSLQTLQSIQLTDMSALWPTSHMCDPRVAINFVETLRVWGCEEGSVGEVPTT